MISTLYTITNKAGATFSLNDHITDPANFLALQSYPQFDVNIKNNEINKEGQHGVWDFFSFYGRRAINFQGVIVGTTELLVETQKELMLNVLGFPTQPTDTRDGQVYLRWTDLAGNDWEIECKLLANVRFNRELQDTDVLEFFFSLKASDPFIVGQTVNSSDGVLGWRTQGATFPLDLPAILGETINDALVIANAGSIDAHTIIRLYGEAQGPVTNPRVSNISTGKTFYLNITLIDETEWVEIDSKLGTVIDSNGNDRSGNIIGASEFITLAPDNNDILYESDENPMQTLILPTAVFNVKYRDTKI